MARAIAPGRGEGGDLAQLLAGPAACDQYRERMCRAQCGTANALRTVFGTGASLEAVMAQAAQGLHLRLWAQGVEPLEAPGWNAGPVRVH